MAPRSSWKGYLKLSLVSVPVRAYTASSSSGAPISLNQLHEECHSRIKHQKVCPIHGEVSSDEIVRGYEYSKGQYVVVDPDELDKLRSESDKSIDVDVFVERETIDPIYHSGKTYYLLPDGPVGQKPYSLIRRSMQEEGLQAVAQVVLSSKEQLVLLRPLEQVIAMTVLDYKTQVKEPSGFEDELTETDASRQEVKLTKQLIGGMLEKNFDLGQYRDLYTEKLTELIEAKVEGKELVSPPEVEEPQVINLMDALKQSVQQVKPPKKAASSQKKTAGKKKPASKKKPAKKTAASARKRTAGKKTPAKKTARRKKKSG